MTYDRHCRHINRHVRPRHRPTSMLIIQCTRTGISTRHFGLRHHFLPYFLHTTFPIEVYNPRCTTIPRMRLLPNKCRLNTYDTFLIPRTFFHIMCRGPSNLQTTYFLIRMRMVPRIRTSHRNPIRHDRPTNIRHDKCLYQRTSIPYRRPIQQGVVRHLYSRTRTIHYIYHRTPTTRTTRLMVTKLYTMRFISTIFLRR